MTDHHADRVLSHGLITLQREEIDWSAEGVWVLRQRLHVMREQHEGELAPLFDEALAHCADLWSLLQGMRETEDAVDHNRTARWLGAAADASGMLEELLSGEDPGGEALASAIPFALHRAAETSYVQSAQVGYRALAREHHIRLADALWRRHRGGGTGMEPALRRRAEIDEVLATVTHSDLSTEGRLVLMAILYRALIQAALQDLARAARPR